MRPTPLFVAILALLIALAAQTPAVEPVTSSGDVMLAALSPGGHRLALVCNISGHGTLWLQDLPTGARRELLAPASGLTAIGQPAFSPDGRWIYFHYRYYVGALSAQGVRMDTEALARVSAASGQIQIVARAKTPGDFAFSPGGRRIAYVTFGQFNGGTLEIASSTGRGAHTLLQLSQTPSGAVAWSPDGRAIAAVVNNAELVVESIAGGKPLHLGPYGGIIYGLAWLPGSRALVISSGPMDDRRPQPGFGASWSPPPGRFEIGEHEQLWQIDLPGGAARQISSGPAGYTRPSLSRGGALVAVRSMPNGRIRTTPPAAYNSPTPARGARITGVNLDGWLADGSLTFERPVHGIWQVWRMAADASEAQRRAGAGGSQPAASISGKRGATAQGPAPAIAAAPITHSEVDVQGYPTPDGRQLVLETAAPDGVTLAVAQADGSASRSFAADYRGQLLAVGNAWLVLAPASHPAALERLPLAGGALQPLHLAGYRAGGTVAISPDGRWLAARITVPALGVWRTGIFHFDGGPCCAPPTATLSSVDDFQWMPGSQALAYPASNQLWSISIPDGRRRRLTRFPFPPPRWSQWRFAPDGRLAVVRYRLRSDAVILRPRP